MRLDKCKISSANSRFLGCYDLFAIVFDDLFFDVVEGSAFRAEPGPKMVAEVGFLHSRSSHKAPSA